MGEGILLSAADIDFMVHGVFSYELFGQTVWITTTHVCVLIVMLVIIGFVLRQTELSGMQRKCRGRSRISWSWSWKSWIIWSVELWENML